MAFDLSHHEHAAARRAVEFRVLLAVLKRVADDALDSFAGVDVFLNRDLVGRALLEDSAGIGVNAFCVFANDDKIHVLGLDAFQWTKRCIEQAHGTNVGVEVHLEAHAEQDFLGMDVGLDARIAEGAGEDGVEIAAEHGEAVGRDGHAVAQIAVGAPVEFAQLDIGSGGPNHFESLRNYFLANSVSGNDGNAFLRQAFAGPRVRS